MCCNFFYHLNMVTCNRPYYKLKNMENPFTSAPVATFQVHPEVAKTYREKDLDSLQFTIAKYGQQTPVKVIESGGQMYIIDGVSRFKCVKQLKLPSLLYEVISIEENKIIEYRMLSNVKTKRKFTEMCLEAEYILNTVAAPSQGKKRELLGFEDLLNDNNYGKLGKDRFDLACALLGVDMKASTLRKAMEVFMSEFVPNGKSESRIIEKLDACEISIDMAHKLLLDKRKKKENIENKTQGEFSIAHLNSPYKLYCKSSILMSQIRSDSIPMCIYSPPYWGQRKYRNQGDLCYGQEATVDEYINNFKSFNEEVYRVLKPGGFVVIIIGESYKGGYQGVCRKAENTIEDIGFKISDGVTWVKKNQKFAPHQHQFRFLNVKETVIVAYKPGAEPYFNPSYRESSSKGYKVKRTNSKGVYIASEKTCISNVIVTPVFNPSDLHEIDPNFNHDAPCHPDVYKIFIGSYSRPGDEVLDIHVGAGTVGIGLQMGRRVIGYDVDPISIEFCEKRFKAFLNKQEVGQKRSKKAA